ncbi:related to dehydrogenases with different specificities (related to short-chain alcohol dehydrogenases) [Ramularia collo-cygni]|uniref:Related to dehydrogenases with different specificities (Related to short-chain alcohol dehydrogenases) n=1 Tax=Ramularia collo-cygni TaxID=112498 RepID=A0A2D3UMS2_9PEZI|nr:related to dehydrogenases with different specificities (related to short-chain alcohol dehydrogenases) [Ramularia collo-cygni]CZT15651.1 related to dehydrogenases with different specificities (related to short-chain alcohol dehydrogenases) [Ramularia collo-cygni]
MAHQGKTVLVTGGAGGLGRAIADNFLSVGANVVICDINDKLLADFNEKTSSTYPDRTLAIKTDITSEAEFDSLFQQIEAKFGHLDYAINNAGIVDRFDPAGTLELDLWNRVIALNLTAPAFVTKRAVNSMLKAEVKGAIVNIASVSAFKGGAAGAAYTASKHGLIGLTKNTTAFYRMKGIRCNAICCGGMQTNIGAGFATNPPNLEGMALMNKSFGEWPGCMADIGGVAKLVASLCDEEQSFVNGAVVTADGGVTAS